MLHRLEAAVDLQLSGFGHVVLPVLVTILVMAVLVLVRLVVRYEFSFRGWAKMEMAQAD